MQQVLILESELHMMHSGESTSEVDVETSSQSRLFTKVCQKVVCILNV